MGGLQVCGCVMLLLPDGRVTGMWLCDGVVTCWEGEWYVAVRWGCHLWDCLKSQKSVNWEGGQYVAVRCCCLLFNVQTTC